jgi:putative membrane protein
VKKFLQTWLINTLAVLVAVCLVKGIHYEKPVDLVVASLLLGVLNAILRPILLYLALPLLVFTLGLFTLVINALVLYFVGNLLRPQFSIDSFWDAFWGALIISIVSSVLHLVTGTSKARFRIVRHNPPRGRGPDGGGPVIDI